MMATYAEKLRDPRWQKKRLEIMERDGFQCRECGDKDSTLNVHHAYYKRGFDPWGYPAEALKTLCEDCHQRYEEQREKILAALVDLDIEQQRGLAEILIAKNGIEAIVSASPGFAAITAAILELIENSDNPKQDINDLGIIVSEWDTFRPIVLGAIGMFFDVSERASKAGAASVLRKQSNSQKQFASASQPPVDSLFDGKTTDEKTDILNELIAAKRRQQGIVVEGPKKIPVAEAAQ